MCLIHNRYIYIQWLLICSVLDGRDVRQTTEQEQETPIAGASRALVTSTPLISNQTQPTFMANNSSQVSEVEEEVLIDHSVGDRRSQQQQQQAEEISEGASTDRGRVLRSNKKLT